MDLLLAPMMGNLTFAEVVGWVLDENRHHEESSLADLQGCHTQIQGELDDLIETRRVESDASSRKRLKREIDLRRKDIKSLRVAISHHQSNLGWGNQEMRLLMMMTHLTMGQVRLRSLRWLLLQRLVTLL